MSLPEWAEAVLRSCAPQPAFGQASPAPEAVERYEALTKPIRRRWRELEGDVWWHFKATIGFREQQARCLLQLMVDSAKYRKPEVLEKQRAAIAELQEVDDALREAFESVAALLAKRDSIEYDHDVESGFDVELMPLLESLFQRPEFGAWAHDHRSGIRAVLDALSSQPQPRLADLIGQIVRMSGWRPVVPNAPSDRAALAVRKAKHDALRALVGRVDNARAALAPVELSHQAIATIANVLFDDDGTAPSTARAVGEALRRIRAES